MRDRPEDHHNWKERLERPCRWHTGEIPACLDCAMVREAKRAQMLPRGTALDTAVALIIKQRDTAETALKAIAEVLGRPDSQRLAQDVLELREENTALRREVAGVRCHCGCREGFSCLNR